MKTDYISFTQRPYTTYSVSNGVVTKQLYNGDEAKMVALQLSKIFDTPFTIKELK